MSNATQHGDRNADFGIVGLGVMGRSLAYNMAGKGVRVAAYDPWPEVMDDFDPARAPAGGTIIAAANPAGLVHALTTPRRILIMMRAGEPVERMIQELMPLLKRGDVIVDGGNSHYRDTDRRARDLAHRRIGFVGAGVSGGEQGALEGPALMLGGSKAAVERVLSTLEAIAARVDGRPCCAVFGEGGAGHFVKMVHNGIEYAEMQAVAETYGVLRNLMGYDAHRVSEVFAQWNRGPLAAYLIEITADILATPDPEDGGPLIDKVLDKAGQKGTGQWAAQSAMELGVPCPSLIEAVIARAMSFLKTERLAASEVLPGPAVKPVVQCPPALISRALLATRLITYAQGMALLEAAAEAYGWALNPADAAAVWRGGCIIRAALLDDILAVLEGREAPASLLLAPRFEALLADGVAALRTLCAAAVSAGAPVPVFASALSYYDSYRTARLPANLIQAQRDRFGAHTYERVDRPGRFHGDWSGTPKKR